MSTALASALVTEAEFLALPESLDHVELIDGEVLLSPAPLPLHQILVTRILVELQPWARAHPPAMVLAGPADIRLGPDRILQPDLSLFLSRVPLHASPIRVLPDLVVEVLSTRRSYDRITKRAIYADAGIPEYWIVDPERRELELVQGRATVAVVRDRIQSIVAPGLTVDLEALFRELV